jgi:hypothetical protein
MNEHIAEEPGRRRWAIFDGRLADESEGAYESLEVDDESAEWETGSHHETLFLVNAGTAPARVELSLFFLDRDRFGPYVIDVPAQGTQQIHLAELEGGNVPRGETFTILVIADRPTVIMASRKRRPESDDAPLTRIAVAG